MLEKLSPNFSFINSGHLGGTQKLEAADVERLFGYALSRKDIENDVLGGP